MKKKSKGERLGWKHLSEVEPVKLTMELLKGEQVFLTNKNNIMEIGQTVKIAGSKDEGVIIKIENRRECSFTDKAFYTVKLTDNREIEVMRDELRVIAE